MWKRAWVPVLVALGCGLCWLVSAEPTAPEHPVSATEPEGVAPPAVPPGEPPTPGTPSLGPPRHADVECELTVDAGSRWATLEEHDPSGGDALATVKVEVEGTWVRFRPVHEEGLGVLHVMGHRPVAIGWAGGACLTLVELQRAEDARIVGRVAGGAAHDLVVDGCGTGATVAPDGRFSLRIVQAVREGDLGVRPGESCPVAVSRMFGTRRLRGQPVDLVPSFDDEVELVLPAPPPPAPPGWDVMEVDDGFRVMAVEPGQAAHKAAVEVGDRIVAVDEEPASDLAKEAVDELELPAVVERLRGADIERIELR